MKELEAARAKVSELERSIEAGLRTELAGLPARYGFADVKTFLRAVRGATGGKAGRRAAQRADVTKAKRRKRAVVTDATRAEVKKLVEAGKTGGEIAKQVEISLPTVQNIKKALRLIKARKAKSS